MLQLQYEIGVFLFELGGCKYITLCASVSGQPWKSKVR